MSQPALNPEFFGTPLLLWRGGSMLATEHLYQPFQRIERHEHNHPCVCVFSEGDTSCAQTRESASAGPARC